MGWLRSLHMCLPSGCQCRLDFFQSCCCFVPAAACVCLHAQQGGPGPFVLFCVRAPMYLSPALPVCACVLHVPCVPFRPCSAMNALYVGLAVCRCGMTGPAPAQGHTVCMPRHLAWRNGALLLTYCWVRPVWVPLVVHTVLRCLVLRQARCIGSPALHVPTLGPQPRSHMCAIRHFYCSRHGPPHMHPYRVTRTLLGHTHAPRTAAGRV